LLYKIIHNSKDLSTEQNSIFNTTMAAIQEQNNNVLANAFQLLMLPITGPLRILEWIARGTLSVIYNGVMMLFNVIRSITLSVFYNGSQVVMHYVHGFVGVARAVWNGVLHIFRRASSAPTNDGETTEAPAQEPTVQASGAIQDTAVVPLEAEESSAIEPTTEPSDDESNEAPAQEPTVQASGVIQEAAVVPLEAEESSVIEPTTEPSDDESNEAPAEATESSDDESNEGTSQESTVKVMESIEPPELIAAATLSPIPALKTSEVMYCNEKIFQDATSEASEDSPSIYKRKKRGKIAKVKAKLASASSSVSKFFKRSRN
jgi:hypothetical protein